MFSLLACVTEDLLGLLFGFPTSFPQYSVSNFAGLVVGVLLDTLRILIGFLCLLEFVGGLLAVTLRRVNVALNGASLQFNFVFSVREITLPVSLTV